LKNLLLLFLFFSTSSFAKETRIILIPGAASSGDQVWVKGMGLIFDPFHLTKYFKNLESILIENGYKVTTCPKTKDQDSRGSIARAQDCLNLLSTLKPKTNFHIIGHSMGGIVGRQILHLNKNKLNIKSLTTISTPHKGSALANFALDKYKAKGIIASALKVMEFTPDKKIYLKEMKMYKRGSRYLRNIRNPYKVPVYSISSYKYFSYFDLLYTPGRFLEKEMINIFATKNIDLRSDGIVPTSSMIYGKHLGVIYADHIESACLLFTKYSRGCEEMLNIMIPHLSRLNK